MSEEPQTAKEAYLEGRLLGLNRLITILKQAMKEDQTTDIDQILVGHISHEMDAILDEMQIHHGEDNEVIAEARKKAGDLPKPSQKTEEKAEEQKEAPPQEESGEKEAAKTPSELKKSVEGADELMKNLMALKQKQDQKEK